VGGEGVERGEREQMYVIYLYENRKMKPVEIVLSGEGIKENDAGSDSV
jgi:hypothetical protein